MIAARYGDQPLIFVASLLADSNGGPEGVPFGDYVRKSRVDSELCDALAALLAVR